MAYSVSVKNKTSAAGQLVKALVDILPTESYPNGNGGVVQFSYWELAEQLAPYGIKSVCLSSGDAWSVGSYQLVAPKKATGATLKALRKLVLSNVQEQFHIRSSRSVHINALEAAKVITRLPAESRFAEKRWDVPGVIGGLSSYDIAREDDRKFRDAILAL